MDIFYAIKDDNDDFLQIKLESGLSPNEMLKKSENNSIPDLFNYETPLLSIASYYGSIKVLKLLLSSNLIDINKESLIAYKFRPIHYSIANNQRESFDILTQSQANSEGILFSSIHFLNHDFVHFIISNHLDDVNSKFQSVSPIEEAIKNQKSTKIAEALLNEGATFDNDLLEFCKSSKEFAKFYELLNQFNMQNISYRHGVITPLHIAADENNVEEAARIIDEGIVDINAVTDNGDTALMKAAHRGSLKIVQLILEQKKVPVNVNQVNNGGIWTLVVFKTALHHACLYAKKNVVLYLLRFNGIDPLIRTILI